MKKVVFVFLVAALFFGTTFAGASIFSKDEDKGTPFPCPSTIRGEPGAQNFKYKDQFMFQRIKSVSLKNNNEISVTYSAIAHFKSDEDGEMTPDSITVYLYENGNKIDEKYFKAKENVYEQSYSFTKTYTEEDAGKLYFYKIGSTERSNSVLPLITRIK